MKKVLGLLAILAIVATPAFAAVQNVKVSGDIDSTYVNRNHFGLGKQKHTNNNIETGLVKQSDFLTQTRLRVEADLSDNVSTTVGLINERAWDAEESSNPTNSTNIQLYLANVTLREFLYSPLSVTVGRQVLSYGNGLILGDGGVNNQATGNLASVAADLTKRSVYDGVKAVLDYKPLTLDLLFVRNTANGTNGGTLNNALDNDDIYGLNANYQLGDASNTVVEAYGFARRNNSTLVGASGSNFNINNRGDTTYVPGLRVSTNPIKGLNVGAEVAGQLGNITTNTSGAKDTARRQALAGQFTASYELPAAEQYKPVAFGSYTYVSGDKNRDLAATNLNQNSGETYTAWDPLFETQGSGTIYNTLFDLTNMHIVSAGLSAKPLEDVTAKATWTGLYADRRYLAGENALIFRQPDGSSATGIVTTGRKDMGNEYDVAVDYAYTEDVLFGVNLGWFVPGTTFDGLNDTPATQALARVLVNF